MSSSYYVDLTDPFSDLLAALGLQRLLADLLEEQNSSTDGIRFVHCGGYVRLDLDEPILEETVTALGADDYIMGGIRFIQTEKNADKLPPNLTSTFVDDYEAQKQQNANFYDALREGKRGNELPPQPPSWDVLRTINPSALPGWTNVLTDWWSLRPHQPTVVGLILEMYSTLPNPVDEMAARWKKLNKEHKWGVSPMATCQQYFNPDQGKGQNRTKADTVSVGNMKAFWLTEYLKMVGFYNDALTKTVAGGKDRKIFVVSPRDMRLGDHDRVLAKFKASVTTEASTRFDILAALRYTQALLEHFLEAEQDELLTLMGVNVRQQLVGGFQTAFYLDLGNAVATMNVSTIALPGWVVIEQAEDAETYRGVLDELVAFTRQFEEKNSDAFTLLQHLRDFVSGDNLDAFFRLTSAFPSYYIGMRERGKYARQLTTPTLERIIRMTDRQLAPILQSEGFQNIATAIRQSTVLPQYRKAQGERLYEIRYGLNQELTRIAKRGKEAEFMAALADFIHKFNAENVRIAETRGVQYRSNVTTNDIDDITRLLDEYGAPTVAQMLVAYGYARVPKDETNENQ